MFQGNMKIYLHFLWFLRDHFVYALSQWEAMLQCNIVTHWLGAYTKWSLMPWKLRWHRLVNSFLMEVKDTFILLILHSQYHGCWWSDDTRSPGIIHHGINTLRLGRNRRHFADNIFKCLFLTENVWILIKISLKFVPRKSINNMPALVPIMAWRRLGDKPLSEPMMVRLPTHICVTRPQWVNSFSLNILVSASEWLTHWNHAPFSNNQCSF